MGARYEVEVCYEPEWFLGKDGRGGMRYYPPIVDHRYDQKRRGYGYDYDRNDAFQYAKELGREIAECDFEEGVGGRCVALFEGDISYPTIYVFDKNGKGKRLERPPYYPFVDDPLKIL